jgi:preprotein translocase subunit SecD
VFLYSLLQYRVLGLVTVASIVVAGLLTYLAITILGWSHNYRLDMAGVTGLIVAIGFTADSFIVYFERIRDELRDGRSLAECRRPGGTAPSGPSSADGVNFLAAVVLYLLASSSVRGFAFTLGLTTSSTSWSSSWFTHPLVALLARRPFFRDGHPWSGLDPVASALSSAKPRYAGRGRFTHPTPAAAGTEGGAHEFALLHARQRPLHRREVGARRRPAAPVLHRLAVVMLIAVLGLVFQGLNLGLEFRGGSEFRVATTSLPADYEDKARQASGRS